jgi:hypothetical protein
LIRSPVTLDSTRALSDASAAGAPTVSDGDRTRFERALNPAAATLDTGRPNLDVPHADLDVPRPKLDVPHPNMDVPHPNMDVPHPDQDVPRPRGDVGAPPGDLVLASFTQAGLAAAAGDEPLDSGDTQRS